MFVEKVALSTVVGARANCIFASDSDLVLIGVPPGCLLFSSAVAAATDLCLHLLQIINHTHTHTHTHTRASSPTWAALLMIVRLIEENRR